MLECMNCLKRLLPLVIIFYVLASCSSNQDPRIPSFDPGDIPEVKIHNYGKALLSIPPDNFKAGLLAIQEEYRFFLDGDLNDTLNVLRLREFVSDPLIRSLADECERKFPDPGMLEDSLGLMFAYYAHHIPGANLPEVFTYISGLNYENPVQLRNNHLIIGLDMFLGAETPWYAQVGMPAFMAHRCTPAHILPACAGTLAALHNTRSSQEDLLGAMIHEGKRLYFMQMLVPSSPDERIIGYTPAQLEWCQANEEKLWAFLVENELLYSPDLSAFNRMMQDGPFTTSFGSESAPRPGHWIGWMIVRSYMRKHSEISIADLMKKTDAHALFQDAAYRPR